MKKLRPPTLILFLFAMASLFAGCMSTNDKYSSIPQDRPANWEGQVPGMSPTPGSGVR